MMKDLRHCQKHIQWKQIIALKTFFSESDLMDLMIKQTEEMFFKYLKICSKLWGVWYNVRVRVGE